MAIVDYFLNIDGIPGESTDAKYKGEIQLNSFSIGESNSSTLGSATGGAGAGKVSFQDFNFTTKFSKASPKLMLACATGKHIPSAVMTARKSGGQGGGFEFLVVKLTTVLVNSIHSQGTDTVPEDAVSLAFAKIEVDYKEQKPIGALGATTSFVWTLAENKAV
ncbi:MAG TPA: type VI secretion system tube protein Hcp [Candidatus Acidoferrum sp.]|jgi:type VI secretion system secreted protein Hcp|nr:type VI secretion system tube protein Hcp [Candidatus Acidoferrum sp.]